MKQSIAFIQPPLEKIVKELAVAKRILSWHGVGDDDIGIYNNIYSLAENPLVSRIECDDYGQLGRKKKVEGADYWITTFKAYLKSYVGDSWLLEFAQQNGFGRFKRFANSWTPEAMAGGLPAAFQYTTSNRNYVIIFKAEDMSELAEN